MFKYKSQRIRHTHLKLVPANARKFAEKSQWLTKYCGKKQFFLLQFETLLV
jgi:hypothetical protein